jgi:hypothetical protein
MRSGPALRTEIEALSRRYSAMPLKDLGTAAR